MSVLSNDYDTLGFIVRWTSSVLAVLWMTLILIGLLGMWRFNMWGLSWTLIIPAILLVLQGRNAWRYRMFKPSDMMTHEQVEAQINGGEEKQ